MNTLDIAMLLIMFLTTLFGVLKGPWRELLALGCLILAVVVSLFFSPILGSSKLSLISAKRPVSNFIIYMVIFLAVITIGAVLVAKFKKVLGSKKTSLAGNITGGILGLLRGTMICAVIAFALLAFPVNDRLLTSSTLTPYLCRGIRIVLKVLPESTKRKLDFIKFYDKQRDIRNYRTV